MSENFDRYLQALRSPDATLRKKAIAALAKSGDKRALKPLAEVYKTDPDPELRELALKAGKHIQKNTTSTQTLAPTGGTRYTLPGDEDDIPPASSGARKTKTDSPGLMFVSTGGYESGESSYGSAGSSGSYGQGASFGGQSSAYEDTPPKRPVNDRDRKKARDYVDRAIDAVVRGQANQAVSLIAAAITLNPELERDSKVLGVLAQAMNIPGDEALRQVKEMNADPTAAKAAMRAAATTGGSWDEVLNFVLESAIWFIVIALLAGAAIYLVVREIDYEALREETTQQMMTGEITLEQAEVTYEVYDFIEEYSNTFVIPMALGYAAAIIGGAMAFSTLAWIIGGTFLGGEGTLFAFLLWMLRVMIVSFFINTIASFGAQFSAPGDESLFVFSCLPTLVTGGLTAYIVGRVHKFGIFTGMLNIVLTYVAIVGLCCGCGFLSAFLG